MSDASLTTVGRLARPGAGHLRLLVQAVLGLAVAGYLAVTAASLLARFSWIADLTTHFRPQLLLAALVLACALVAARRPWWVAPIALAAAVHAVVLLRPVQVPAAAAAGPSLRLLTFNVLSDNRRFDDVLGYIRREAPDVVVLEEAEGAWRRRVRPLTASLPYSTTGEGASVGTIVFSRFPIISESVEFGRGWKGSRLWEPAVRVVLDVAGQPTVLWAVHPSSPISRAQWNRRNAYLAWLAGRVAGEPAGRPVIVAGDFNITPWSPWYWDWARISGLVDSAGTGWPAITRRPFLPMRPHLLGVPIDRVSVSPAVAVTAHRIGPELGSDHLPVTVDLTLPKGSR